jgi:hypothetical protein
VFCLYFRDHVMLCEASLIFLDFRAFIRFSISMAGTTPQRHSVHWAPSPSPSSPSLSSVSSVSSTSTLQYINAQLVSHGFVLTPGLCLDGLSSADVESVTKCLLSMLSQRVVGASLICTVLHTCTQTTTLPVGGYDARRGPHD